MAALFRVAAPRLQQTSTGIAVEDFLTQRRKDAKTQAKPAGSLRLGVLAAWR
jgi:hypothetical protein